MCIGRSISSIEAVRESSAPNSLSALQIHGSKIIWDIGRRLRARMETFSSRGQTGPSLLHSGGAVTPDELVVYRGLQLQNLGPV